MRIRFNRDVYWLQGIARDPANPAGAAEGFIFTSCECEGGDVRGRTKSSAAARARLIRIRRPRSSILADKDSSDADNLACSLSLQRFEELSTRHTFSSSEAAGPPD